MSGIWSVTCEGILLQLQDAVPHQPKSWLGPLGHAKLCPSIAAAARTPKSPSVAAKAKALASMRETSLFVRSKRGKCGSGVGRDGPSQSIAASQLRAGLPAFCPSHHWPFAPQPDVERTMTCSAAFLLVANLRRPVPQASVDKEARERFTCPMTWETQE